MTGASVGDRENKVTSRRFLLLQDFKTAEAKDVDGGGRQTGASANSRPSAAGPAPVARLRRRQAGGIEARLSSETDSNQSRQVIKARHVLTSAING